MPQKDIVVAAVLAGGGPGGYGNWPSCHAMPPGKSQIPLEAQIEGLKVDISRLIDIDAGWPKIAKYETEIKELKKDLDDKQVKMTKMEREIAAATDALEAKVVKVKYKDQDYTPSRAAKVLNDDLNSFVALKKYVASRTNLLSAREQKLATAMARQKEMINQKGKLQAEVAQVEADLELLRLQQTESKLPSSNDTRLDDIKEKLRGLRTRSTKNGESKNFAPSTTRMIDSAPIARKDRSERRRFAACVRFRQTG